MNAILAMSLSVNIFYFKPELNFKKAKKKNVISFRLCFQLSKLQSDHGNLESDKIYSAYIFHTGNPLSAPPAPTELIYMQNVSYSTVRSTWTVSCFRADIFVFLLSTRAGGLGINLTAADTVGNLILCFIGSYLVRIHLTISQSRAFAFCFFFRRPGQIARNLRNDCN